MFKWIFILFIGFLALWMLESGLVPEHLKSSTFGKTLNSIVFGLNYKIHASSQSSKKFDSQIVSVDDTRLQSILKSLNTTNQTAIIYFYDTHCFFCRFVLQDINRVARENANNKIIFMVVAFDDNRDRLNFLLSGFDKLYFRPIITSPSSIKSAAVSLAKFNVGISETPATVYKGLTSANYTIITTDFSTRRELTALIINKN